MFGPLHNNGEIGLHECKNFIISAKSWFILLPLDPPIKWNQNTKRKKKNIFLLDIGLQTLNIFLLGIGLQTCVGVS